MRHAVGGVHSPVCNIHYPPGPHSPAKMFTWKPYSSLIAILKIDPWDPLGCMRFMIMWSFQLNLGCLCIAWYHQAIHPYLSIKSVWAFLYGKCVCGILIDIDFEISEINRDKQNGAYIHQRSLDTDQCFCPLGLPLQNIVWPCHHGDEEVIWLVECWLALHCVNVACGLRWAQYTYRSFVSVFIPWGAGWVA